MARNEDGRLVIEKAEIIKQRLKARFREASGRSLSSGMRGDIQALGLTIEAFTDDQAEYTAQLWLETKKHGLSLADRACLSLGYSLGLPILTMDRAWEKPALALDIKVLR